MVANSLVFKQDSTYYEHFYRHLEPWKHYIPLKSDLSDVIEKLKWAKDHDSEVVLMSMYVCIVNINVYDCTQLRARLRISASMHIMCMFMTFQLKN